VEQDLRAAGAAAVAVNAPMGSTRLDDVVAWLAERAPADVLDLGCGHGALLVALARAVPEGTALLGIDLDEAAVVAARARAEAAGVGGRVEVALGDAGAHDGAHDAVTCVGAAHALGGAAGALARLHDLVRPGGAAVLGDGIWATEPDGWCRDAFGDLPTRDGLVEAAAQMGWRVADVDESTLEEWDAFEAAWTAGVEAVGTDAARAFAAARRQEYRRYRGVLGFAWLRLRRPDGDGRAAAGG
jgi:cyclopropane fatty-acyl-phospholipid synthase-like methyltransferase